MNPDNLSGATCKHGVEAVFDCEDCKNEQLEARHNLSGGEKQTQADSGRKQVSRELVSGSRNKTAQAESPPTQLYQRIAPEQYDENTDLMVSEYNQTHRPIYLRPVPPTESKGLTEIVERARNFMISHRLISVSSYTCRAEYDEKSKLLCNRVDAIIRRAIEEALAILDDKWRERFRKWGVIAMRENEQKLAELRQQLEAKEESICEHLRIITELRRQLDEAKEAAKALAHQFSIATGRAIEAAMKLQQPFT